MSYSESLEDNIRSERDKYNDTVYYPKCHICGAEVKSYSYIRSKVYKCMGCKVEKKLTDKVKRVKDNHESKERKFTNAITRIQKLNISFKEYLNAINKVHDELHNVGHFDSTEEIMAAIELTRNNIEYRHQVKFGTRYMADFVIDDEEIVLEIDGVLFHTEDKIESENIRDNLIVMTLGVDWEVIRISDTLINQNLSKLVPAIIKTRDKRKEVRANNKECLPKWYSDRK